MILIKKHLPLLLLLLIFITGCAPQASAGTTPPSPTDADVAIAASPLPQDLPPLRYAILSPTNSVNIWALFDAEGASYENYAVKGEYYPRLYRFLPLNNELTPILADGLPSPIIQDGEFFSSMVTLFPDLEWDDGTPLTAEDIAFTVNTSLEFELGLNWADFYNIEKIHHVEALDEQTLKYYFSSPPSVGDWQQGALTGIFVSKSYWEWKIARIKDLLPPDEENPKFADYQVELKTLQDEELDKRAHLQELKVKNAYYREQEIALENNLGRQEVLKKNLVIIQKEKREHFDAARTALYALSDYTEPHAGLWQPSAQDKEFTENISVTNAHFEIARYTLYKQDDALKALFNNEVDFVLNPEGLKSEEIAKISKDPEIQFVENRRNDIRFMAFNHQRSPLDDIALRRALYCVIDTEFLALDKLDGRVAPAFGWIHPENTGWHSSTITPPCVGLDADARLAQGMRLLKTAGYVWEQEPSPNQAGSGLLLPSGEAFPAITILAPSDDPDRTEAASYIAEGARQLGLPLVEEIRSAEDIFFAVYGVEDYDLAIMGWQLSFYPDYLCEFFAQKNPYSYHNAAVNQKCAELSITSGLSLARQQFFDLEILLWDDLPAIPLFSRKITEAYRNIALPFDNVLGGIAPSLYGAPTLAEPK